MNNGTFSVYSTKLSYLCNIRLFISIIAFAISIENHLENQVIKSKISTKMSFLYLKISKKFQLIFILFCSFFDISINELQN